MMSFVTDSLPVAAEEMRPLTASEIDFIAGGAFGTLGGVFASTKTLTLAFQAGPLSIATGIGLAIGFGPGSSAGIGIGAIAIG